MEQGKGCLERQPSSVPFIVQYESRNNQVHFTGCKVRKIFWNFQIFLLLFIAPKVGSQNFAGLSALRCHLASCQIDPLLLVSCPPLGSATPVLTNTLTHDRRQTTASCCYQDFLTDHCWWLQASDRWFQALPRAFSCRFPMFPRAKRKTLPNKTDEQWTITFPLSAYYIIGSDNNLCVVELW